MQDLCANERTTGEAAQVEITREAQKAEGAARLRRVARRGLSLSLCRMSDSEGEKRKYERRYLDVDLRVGALRVGAVHRRVERAAAAPERAHQHEIVVEGARGLTLAAASAVRDSALSRPSPCPPPRPRPCHQAWRPPPPNLC